MTDDEFRVTPIRPRARPHSAASDPLGALKRFFAEKSGLAGGGGGDGNGGHRNGSGRRGSNTSGGKVLIYAALLVVTIWGVYSSFFTVDVSEEGVVTRFGAYNRTAPSGMHGKLPFGIERVVKVQSKRILQEEFGFRTRKAGGTGERSEYEKSEYASESLMLTGDLNVADVEWIVQFRIADPWKYLFHARDVIRNVRDVSMSIMRRVVGDRLVGDVLTTGRVEIADQARVLTQEVLDQYDMGIRIERIILQGANPPEKVKPAFNDVNTAKQEQEQTINNAEREYNKIIPEARGKAEKLISDAEAYAIDIENRAKGDAAQFDEVHAAYRKAPDVTKKRLYIDALEEVLGKASNVTIVDPQIKALLPLLGLPSHQATNQPPTGSN